MLPSTPSLLIFATRSTSNRMLLNNISDNITQLTHYPANKFQQPQYFIDLIHPDDVSQLRQQLNALDIEKNGTFVLADYRLQDAKQQWHWISESVSIDDKEIFSYLSDISVRKQREQQLVYEKQLLQTQQDLSPDGILVMDTHHRIVSWNQGLLDLWDISADLFALTDNNEIMEVIKSKVNDPETFITVINELRQPGSMDEINIEIELRNGVTLERHSKAIIDKENNYQGRVWFMHDITHKKTEARDLRDSEQLFSLAVKAASDGIWSWDFQADSIWFSPHWKEQLGYSNDELPNDFASWQKVIYDKDYSEILIKVRDFISGRSNKFELFQRFTHKKGHIVYIRNCAVCESDEHGNVVRIVGAHTDITPQRNIEQKLKALTLTDALTQLYNQHSFLQQLSLSIKRCQRYHTDLTLVLMDLDHFHQFNVKYGYHRGDAMLINIAKILKKITRDVDICGRYGGEEFALLLPETDIIGGKKLIIRLQSALKKLLVLLVFHLPTLLYVLCSFFLCRLFSWVKNYCY